MGFANKEAFGTKLCFFIDGLDEYVSEHADLVELLDRLCTSPFVKMRISSRPWNVFTNAYDGRANGQLSVQDLTHEDILKYINDTISADNLFASLRDNDLEGYNELVSDITSKAQGVFLWVRLALRSLSRGLRNGDDVDTLKVRLSEYPDELGAFYRRMFERIEKIYRKSSARILLAAISAGRLPIRAPRCIELEMARPDYAQRLAPLRKSAQKTQKVVCRYSDVPRFQRTCLPCWGQVLLGLSAIQNRHRGIELRQHLDARCADFLEPVAREGGVINRITPIHRTASGFLNIDALNELEERAGPDYDVSMSLARVYFTGFQADHDVSWLALMSTVGPGVFPIHVAEYRTMLSGIQGSGSEAMFGRGRMLLPKSTEST